MFNLNVAEKESCLKMPPLVFLLIIGPKVLFVQVSNHSVVEKIKEL